MALFKCKECGTDVSTTAAACPKCGASIKAQTRHLGCGSIISLFVVLGIAIAGITSNGSKQSNAPTKTAEEIAADAAEKVADEKRFDLAFRVAKSVRASARNPDSVVFEALRIDAPANLACAQFRGQNGFGGMSREYLVIKNGKQLDAASFWNKECTKELFDYLSAT